MCYMVYYMILTFFNWAHSFLFFVLRLSCAFLVGHGAGSLLCRLAHAGDHIPIRCTFKLAIHDRRCPHELFIYIS